ncbi:MAG TPA: Hsp33 family molecular chaperone HslO [Opitutaceae bacterium]|nr:Hsp33 family molecular chaperone HslO [Opitutaceae bacterium]
MSASTPINAADPGLEVRTHFVRSRNVLLARADFSQLYVDYYLHLSDQAIRPAPEHDALFKRALAGFVLHAASRPWNETIAWTINFQQPLVNLFITGDNQDGSVTGRVFDENVKELPSPVFYCDVVRGQQPKRRSAVEFSGSDPLVAAEAFYTQSEQRKGRFFQTGEEEFVLAVEHPDCDVAWLDALTTEQVKSLDKTEEVSLLERRIFRWHCGCNQQRMLEVLAPVFRAEPEELFGGDEKLEMRCPRCGARHLITREALEAFVAPRS